MNLGLLTMNPKKQHLGYWFLGAWVVISTVTITLLMATHIAPFRAQADPRQVTFLRQLDPTVAGWQAMHVLAHPCECSADVGIHLINRGRDKRLTSETVIFIGKDESQRQKFEAAGFRYLEMTGEEVVRTTGVEAAPSMTLLSDASEVAYVGGYYQHRSRTEALDGPIIAKAIAGVRTDSLPTFGCAISKRMKEATDPLGMKYSDVK